MKILLAIFALSLSACGRDSATGPAPSLASVVGSYALVSANNQPLPVLTGQGLYGTDVHFNYYDVAGSLTLNADLTYTRSRTIGAIWVGLPGGGQSDTVTTVTTGTFELAGRQVDLHELGYLYAGAVESEAVAFSCCATNTSPGGITFRFQKQ